MTFLVALVAWLSDRLHAVCRIQGPAVVLLSLEIHIPGIGRQLIKSACCCCEQDMSVNSHVYSGIAGFMKCNVSLLQVVNEWKDKWVRERMNKQVTTDSLAWLLTHSLSHSLTLLDRMMLRCTRECRVERVLSRESAEYSLIYIMVIRLL